MMNPKNVDSINAFSNNVFQTIPVPHFQDVSVPIQSLYQVCIVQSIINIMSAYITKDVTPKHHVLRYYSSVVD